MKAKEIRKKFLDFFKNKNHQIIPSAPLISKDDSTLMFTNAGMNQFKDYFLGVKKPTFYRVANTQKCLRVSGKHNDLEEVGIDSYHHTMFEMLGNWSFGEYFKKEAIAWAWELLTQVYLLPKDRLYVTVFEGDAKDRLESDLEAINIWKQYVEPERIILGSKKDNFWEMGDIGPCGPCSEIHIDLREDKEIEKISGIKLINKGHPLVIEIWNLVFIQFNRLSDGNLENLPKKHIDTGMGFERLAMAIQKKHSSYETDIFQPVISFISKKTGFIYGKDNEKDIAIRVISDHIRAIAFAIADGQLPSNNKAGYVIRRILRRAIRYGYSFLGFQKPFLFELINILCKQFGDVFPEIKSQQTLIEKIIRQEEKSFLKTLDKGLKILYEWMKNNEKKSNTISGETVFELYDTFGFPSDLTCLIAKENKFKIDEQGFNKQMALQKQRSRNATFTKKLDWIQVHEGENTDFTGYDENECYANILGYWNIKNKKENFFYVVLDKTPFYPEGGGQVGDTGYLETETEKIPVLYTKKENSLIVHTLPFLPKNLKTHFKCKIDKKRRYSITNNHTATHLLHAALKQVLGNHIIQKGSLVNEHMLRFDFSHYTKTTEEQLKFIEEIVNEKIRANIVRKEQRTLSFTEAKEMGATALFGEKYSDYVRVITFDKDFSIELCGGTHVSSTGEIGFFKIISESAVAAGVRRIEAITGKSSENFINKELSLIKEVKDILKYPKDLIKSLNNLICEKIQLEKQLEKFHNKELQQIKENLLGEINSINGISFLFKKVHLKKFNHLRQLAFEIRSKIENVFLVLATEIQGKAQIAVMISDQLIKEKGYDAREIVKDLAKEIQGNGGGQRFFAIAGGKDIRGLEKTINKAKNYLI